jgi:hypothetical protein
MSSKLTTKNTTVSFGSDAINSALIRNSRIAHGNPGTHCPLCGRTESDPYRRTIGGVIIEGCIDAFHTGALPIGSDTYAWHTRPWARVQRLIEWESVRELTKA